MPATESSGPLVRHPEPVSVVARPVTCEAVTDDGIWNRAHDPGRIRRPRTRLTTAQFDTSSRMRRKTAGTCGVPSTTQNKYRIQVCATTSIMGSPSA